MLPRDVQCPRCKARVNWPCISESHKGTWRAKTHAMRWKAAGIDNPTDDDRSRDYEDGVRRDLEINDRANRAVSRLMR